MKIRPLTFLLFFSLLLAGEQTLLFSGNNRGLLGPCPCDIPMGGLARMASLQDSLDTETISIGAGNHFFSGMPQPGEDQIAAQQRAHVQAEILSMLNYEVMNVGEFDLSYGLRFLQSLEERYGSPFISANLMDKEGNHPFPPYRIISRNGISVAFIGICSPKEGFNFRVADPRSTLDTLLKEDLHRHADFVVLLADARLEELKRFLDHHPGIDFTVFAKEIFITPLPQKTKSGSRAHLGFQGQFSGILRLRMEDDHSAWTDLSEAHHSMKIAEKQVQNNSTENTTLQRQYRKSHNQSKRRFQQLVRKNKNYYIWEIVQMLPHIPERRDILERIPEAYTKTSTNR
jgi:2',3'-cyclic-nucleotide 2'-phosphodiesterase (5'-nucleotidase family)